MFVIPCVKNITAQNLDYADLGMYELAYRVSDACTSVIKSSYYLEDLADAFKEFINKECSDGKKA